MEHSKLKKDIESNFETTDLDSSGKAKYVNCYSHRWVLDNVTRKKHSRLGRIFQDHLAGNTLVTGIWMSIILGSAAMLIGMVMIVSIIAIGPSVAVIFIGFLVILGPSEPATAEELMSELLRIDSSELHREDYVYVSLAMKSIKKWVVVSFLLGTLFVAISPWGDSIPTALSFAIGLFSEYLLWYPALALMEVGVFFSILYLAGAVVFFLIIVPKLIIGFVKKRHDDEPEDRLT